ncbi:hypothetical protein ABT56_03645 [Photobacterium aquae]|uniref:OmpR/PhoB-type domain-containing protein n=1 Tax=Photobacterium aquae TaxID=1195763 RepID=A0A0J1HCB5_9GAMM|nr:winged helix-turn-helix domain-containing protein [Photobacterium aquae]KLV09293.1 hypothetical protein ABT56_03645 [Photobacterium aquae]
MNGSYIELGKWILDLETGRLFLNNDLSACVKVIPNKPLEFLSVLCCGNGQVVDKDIIVDAVWRGHTSPENITQTVNKLRILLDDYDKEIIVNVPGKGYILKYSEYLFNDKKETVKEEFHEENISLNKSVYFKIKVFLCVALMGGFVYFATMYINQVSFDDAVLSDEYSSCDVSEKNSTIVCK